MSESAGLIAAASRSARWARVANLLRGPQGFDSYEHKTLGDLIRIERLDLLEGGYPADWDTRTLRVGDKLKLQYGQIIALGGDFYAEPDAPISNGTTDHDRHERFRKAYARLVNCDRDELKRVLDVMAIEESFIDRRLREGVWPDVAYGMIDLDTKYRHAVDREHLDQPYSRYILMALNNFDHFGMDAISAYKAGHHVALETAVQARGRLAKFKATVDAELHLETALAMNAFADHFLTDLFAAGHLRTPRRRLAEQNGGSQAEGGALSRSQHGEDNAYGLFVRNALGERWLCTGDATLMTPAGAANRRRALAAVQVSMQEVIDAFRTGAMIRSEDYGALKIAPDVAFACRDEAIDKVLDESGRLNHVAQFIDRSVEMPGVALVLSIFVRHPLSAIDARSVRELRYEDGTFLSLGEDEFFRTLFGCEHGLYGPPKHALPKPPAPIAAGTAPSDANRGTRRTRYATAYVGTRAYPGGGSAEYLSTPSDWSEWIGSGSGQAPVIRIPPLGTVAGRAMPHHVAIIRQGYNDHPQLDIARVEVATTEQRFVDVR